jgi:hypothetical protein
MGPLANQPCPCESSLCPHHNVDKGEFCPNKAEGDRIGIDPIMLYLGPCCRKCAESMANTGGAKYVMPPIGEATMITAWWRGRVRG